MSEQSEFDMLIQRHLDRAHRLRAIQQMIAEDPGMIPDLLEVLSDPNPATAPTAVRAEVESRSRTDARVQADRVVAFFRGRQNDVASVREITEGTGLSRNTITALMYTSGKKDLFYRLRVGPKRVLWRLREGGDDAQGVVDDPDIVAEYEEVCRDEVRSKSLTDESDE